MRKKQGICWRTADRKEQQTFGISVQKRSAVLTELLLFTVSTLIFLCTAFHMLCDVLSLPAEFSEGTGVLLFVVTVLSFLGTEVSVPEGKWWRRLSKWGVPLVGGVLLGCFLWFSENAERFFKGILAVIDAYFDLWTGYYGGNSSIGGGEGNEVKFALNVLFVTLCVVLTWAARRLQRNLLPAVVPFAVLVAGLLVGSSCKDGSLLVLAGGMLIANSLGWLRTDFSYVPGAVGSAKGKNSPFCGLLTGLFVLLLCLMVKVACLPAAKEAVTEHAGKIESLQKNVIAAIKDVEFWRSPDVSEGIRDLLNRLFSDKEDRIRKVDNDTPEYENKPVLRVTVDEKPKGTLYLKSFYAANYRGGIWDNEEDAFLEACRRIGYNYEGLSGRILSSAANHMAQNVMYEDAEQKASIVYFEDFTESVHLPYFTIMTDERVVAENDGRFVRTEEFETVSFRFFEFDPTYRTYLTLSKERDAWETWYENYVLEEYLDVPEGMEEVKKAAKQIKQWDKRGTFFQKGEETTELRLAKALLVAEWVKEQANYSLTPPELPKGADPVEYFIGTGKAGYCMHYASAGVLIMRELGIPARYASGYVVNLSSFAAAQQKYSAQVLDSSAHAWAEIYLNGVGWVPVECTDGYAGLTAMELLAGETEAPGAGENQQRPGQNVAEEQQTPPERPESKEESENVPTPGPEITPSREETSVSQAGGVQGSGGGASSSEDEETEESGFYVEAVLIIFLVPICGLLKGVVIPWLKKSKIKWQRRSYERIKKKAAKLGKRQAIKWLNRKLFKTLRRRGKIGKATPKDAEYEAVLRNLYHEIAATDWTRYMDLVKAAAFSFNEFSEEDIAFCLAIYQKALFQ